MWLLGNQIPADEDVQALHAHARALAQAFGHDYIGVEHVFLSLRKLPPDHSIWAVMRAFEIDLDAFFSELESKARVPLARIAPPALPFTPRLRNILRAANRMARQERSSHVTPLHLLAAVAYERGSLPAVLLATAYRQAHPEIPYERLLANTLLHRLLFPGSKELP